MSSSAMVVAALAASSSWLSAGCDALPSSSDGRFEQALSSQAPALAPRDEWRHLSIDLEMAVTPRWSPSGRALLLRGSRGIGLFVVSRRDGELLHAEHGYRGDARFTPEGRLCRGPRGEARSVVLEVDQRDDGAAPCDLVEVDERYGELLWSEGRTAVYHDAYEGSVTRVEAGAGMTRVATSGAWSVAVSRDGRRIAWSTGTLEEPVLWVHDPSAPATSLGRGAHPAWSPAGRHLIFARPSVADGPAGEVSYDSELYVYDVATRELTALTETPDVAEMQPTVSPDGSMVAFADWQAGDVVLASISGLDAAGGER